MKMKTLPRPVLVLIACLCAPLSEAQTIWNGPPITVSDATQPDKITANVWLERGSTEGLYNAAQESGFTHFLSPVDTEWADKTSTNYILLSYTDWNTWAKNIHGGPPNTVGVSAVVHLISDNIYIDITFTSWSSGGGFSYQRATPAVVNTPPSVTIASPTNGTVLSAPAMVTVTASVTNGSGTVNNVQFFDGASSLGNAAANPYRIVTSLTVGSHTLTAVATDNNGLTATNSVTVSVVTPVAVNITVPAWTSPSSFQFSYFANAGLRYIVQRSTNLPATNWLTLATNTAASGSVIFTDITATANSGFYRVGLLPNP
jgi:Bacterial Ig domain